MADDKLYVRFATPRSLLEQEPHLGHGGLFIPVPDPPPVPLARIGIRVFGPFGLAEFNAQVVQIAAGAGMAVTFEDPGQAEELLKPLLRAARDRGQEQGEQGAMAEVSWEKPADFDSEGDARSPLFDQIRAMSTQERMRLARHGNQAERLILMKDQNRTVQTFLIRNPNITLDEVRYMAGNRQTGADVLEMISANREWLQNPGIVQALIRNPKTPTPTAIRLLDKVPVNELRRLAKSNDVRRPIAQAARKRLMPAG